jgi:hypothetical protein|tara:strand:+ start:2076 stop:2234 length:159 start_codon:yes stop_codon:yes gene_type:complete
MKGPPNIKVPTIPKVTDIPAMEFAPPSAYIPYFPPIVIPPSNLELSTANNGS